MRWTKWWVGGALVLAAALAWLQFGRPKAAPRVYRIGWTDSPPFEVPGADGQPTGLAVDLVRTAAQRRGIRLQWVYWDRNSEKALTGKVVDLWPLMTATPDRLQRFYVSQPYLEAEFCLLVRADSPYAKMQDLANSTISFADRPVDAWELDSHLPHVRKLSRGDRSEVMDDLCRQRADAAFMTAFAGIATLLETRGACAQQALRWISAPEIRSRLGIAAPAEFRGTADALRDEIGKIAAEGKLAPILGQSGYMSQQLESMEALLEARRNGQRLAGAVALFAFLFAAACWQSVRFLRETRRTRRTEQALRETEQKLRLMANNMKETVLAYDMERRLIFANPAVETLTGYRIADLEKERFINWVHPDDQARMLGRWDGLFQGSGFEDEEYRMVARDGRAKWVSATWGPMRDDAGRQIGVQGSERDVTERRALQEQYLQAQKLESVGRLAGGVAHDFNNLLTVINGYSHLIAKELRAGDPLKAYVEQVRDAGERAAVLTRQLLAFSRKQVAERQPLNLNALIAESKEMLRRLVGEDVRLRTALAPDLDPIMADSGQILQVLMNLLVNARDAMPDGGEVLIETSHVDIGLSAGNDPRKIAPGPYLLLTVADNGSGIDEETQRHIFEPFFTTKPEGRGTGLGLSTVYGIVQQNQGWIEVASEPGGGAAFRIHFPQVRCAAGQAAPPAAPDGAVRGFETVLVVEDQASVRDFVSAVLASYGYKVIAAADGADAMALAERHAGRIDLVLTDVVMPGMNGPDLVEKLRRGRPEIRAMFMSGYAEETIAHRVSLIPGAQSITKPFTPELLAARLRDSLDGAR
jgi:PAS domain S-box-containing protein